jgi:N-acyl-D-amino-acid deacylase
VAGTVALGQVYPPGYQPNPLTGGYAPRTTYNPFTGAGAPPPAVNPFTGAPAAASPNVNPFTGRPVGAASTYNPLTGKYQPGQPVATPTSPQVYAWPKGKFPITGQAGPGLEPLDDAVQRMMDRHGIPGASLAIAKNGKLVYAKGFGWSDLAAALRVDPTVLFALASVSKPLTALAILLLVERGQLSLDDRAFEVLKAIKPPPGARVDPRLSKITIRQLLNHSGGWDRDKSGDPTSKSPTIARALAAPLPLGEDDFICFMLGEPLDFEPGTQSQYSNVGYIVLGKVIETVSGQSYQEFVQKNVLQPAGVRDAFAAMEPRSYRQREARRYLPGTSMLLPPMDMPFCTACGGWNASAVDMVRVLTALDGTRGRPLLKPATFEQMLALPPLPIKPDAKGTYYGLGFPSVSRTPIGIKYGQDGFYLGTRTFMRHNDKGVAWSLLFNISMSPDAGDDRSIMRAMQEVHARVEAIANYPNVDYFAQYP